MKPSDEEWKSAMNMHTVSHGCDSQRFLINQNASAALPPVRGSRGARTCRLAVGLGFIILHSSFCLPSLGQYSLDWDNVSGGGGASTGGDYVLSDTLGQLDGGTMSGGTYTLDIGFWGMAMNIYQSIAGMVAYYPANYPQGGLSGKVVAGVTMMATGDTNLSVVTLTDGCYCLSGMAANGAYCVTPGKADDSAPANGVTVADLAMIQAQVLGKLHLGPYQLLAADVNTNGTITVADLALIQAVILGKLTSFPPGLWRFVPADYVFPDPLNPWTAPMRRSYANQLTDVTDGDFVAMKLGDVNNSWKAPAGGPNLVPDGPKQEAVSAAGAPVVWFMLGEQSAQRGQVVTVEVSVSGFSRVTSAQFSLGWDPRVLRYAGTGSYGLGGLSVSCFGTTLIEQGKLAFAWYDAEAAGVTLADGAVLFSVSFEVIGKAGGVSAVTLTDSPTPEEVSVDLGLGSLMAKGGSVAVVGPGVVVKQPSYAMGLFQLSLSTEKGRAYTLEYSDTLVPAKWAARPAVVGDGTLMVLKDRAATNHQRFYRVRVE
jgi:hypothetical protein